MSRGSKRLAVATAFLLLALAAVLLLLPGAVATTVYVGTNLTDDAANRTWDSVQEGLYDAAENDTVYVYNGTYLENVTLSTHWVTVRGESRDGVVIDRQSLGNAVFTVRANHAVLQNLTLQQGTYGVYVDGAGYHNGTLDNVTATLINYDCIYIRYAHDWTVHDTDASSCGYSGFSFQGNPLYNLRVWSVSVTTTTNYDGMYISYVTGLWASNLTFTGTGRSGLFAQYSSDLHFSNFLINTSGYNGGVWVSSAVSDSSWDNGSIRSTGDYAFYAYDADFGRLDNLTVEPGSYGGLYMAGQSSYWTWRTVQVNTTSRPLYFYFSSPITVEAFQHDIDTSNMIGGVPIVYIVNSTGGSYAGPASFLAVVNSTGVNVTVNTTIAGLEVGVFILYTNRSTIWNINSSGNGWNYVIERAYNNTFANLSQTYLRAGAYSGGIYVYASSYNLFNGGTWRNTSLYAYAVDVRASSASHFNTFANISCEGWNTCFSFGRDSEGNRLDGSSITGSYYGVYANYASSFEVGASAITSVYYYGIYGYWFSGTPAAPTWIHNNTFNQTPYYYAVYLYGHDGAVVENNTFNDTSIAIYGSTLDGLVISNNVINASRDVGIRGDSADYWVLTGNTITNSTNAGIYFYRSSYWTLRSNTIPNETVPMSIQLDTAIQVRFANHDVDTSNVVNGLPVLWVVNATSGAWNGSYGWLVIDNSSNVSVSSTSPLARNQVGVLLVGVNDSTVSGVNSTANTWGFNAWLSDRNTVADSRFAQNTGGGMHFWRSDWNTVLRTTLRPDSLRGDYGVLVDGSSSNLTFESGDCAQFSTCIYATYDSAHLRVFNSTLNDSYYGVYSEATFGPWVSGNLMNFSYYYHVYIGYSSSPGPRDYRVSNNTMGPTYYYAVSCYYCQGGLIEDNVMYGAAIGVHFYYGQGGIVARNQISGMSTAGIYGHYSDFHILIENTIRDGTAASGGVYFSSSRFWTLRDNNVTNQSRPVVWSFSVPMPSLEFAMHDADASNMANGYPWRWWVNATGVSFNGTAGVVILTNSTAMNVTVSNPVDRAAAGVSLVGTNGSTIYQSNLTQNDWGMVLYHSHNNTFQDMTVWRNTGGGAYFTYSDWNRIQGGAFTPDSAYADYGVRFDPFARNNTVSTNITSFSTAVYMASGTAFDNGIDGGQYSLNYYGLYSDSYAGTRAVNASFADNYYYHVYIGGGPSNARFGRLANNTLNRSMNYYAVYIYSMGGGVVEDNLVNGTGSEGIYLQYSNNITVARNLFTNVGDCAIYGVSSPSNYIVGNVITLSRCGFYFQDSRYWTVVNNSIFNLTGSTPWAVYMYSADPVTDATLFMHTWTPDNTINGGPVRYYVNATGVTFMGPAGWIVAVNSTFMDLGSTTPMSQNHANALFVKVFNSTIRNTVSNGSYYGAVLSWGADNRVLNISANASYTGVYLSNNTRATIDGVYTSNASSRGVDAYQSTRLNVSNSTFYRTYYGVYLDYRSQYVNITNNAFGSCGYTAVYTEATDDVRIVGNTILDSVYYGLYLNGNSGDQVNRARISGNRLNNSGYYDSMTLVWTYSSTVEFNNVTNSTSAALYLSSSNGNTIQGNTFRFQSYGYYLYFADSNTFLDGTVSNSTYTLYLGSGADFNLFYHNNFFTASGSFYDAGTSNVYHNGYPSGGNYWSNTSHTDLYRGSAQTTSGSDGINDTSLLLPYGRVDSYPLSEPWPPYLNLVGPANNSVIAAGVPIDFNISFYFDSVQYGLNNGTTVNLTTPFDINTSGASDGDLFVQLWANDSTGFNLSATYLFVIDSTAPTITADGPTPGGTYAVGTQLNFTVFDAHLAANVTWNNGGGDLSLTAPWDISTAAWAEGDYNITIRAWDTAENSRTSVFVFQLDSTAPTISLVSPANNSFIAVGTTIDLSVSDLHLSTVTWDTGSGANLLTAPFDISTTGWGSGTWSVTVIANDTGGLSTTRVFVFTIDATPPTITLVSPANNSVFFVGQLLNFDVADTNLLAVTWSNGGAPAPLASPYDVSTTGWADGTYSVTITANDTAGNVATRVFLFTVDTVEPSISLATPANGSFISAGTVLNFSISDATLDTSAVNWSNGGAATAFTVFWNVSTSGWADGSVTVTVRAADLAGNARTALFSFTVDSVLPTVSLTSPSNGAVVRAGTTIVLAIADTNLNTSAVNWSNGAGATAFAAQWSISTTGWADGSYTITVRAADLAGNLRVATYGIVIDSTGPVILLTSPAPGSFVPVGTSAVFSISDANLVSATYERLWGPNTTGPLAFGVQWQINTLGWTDGDQIIVRAIDAAGNEVNYTAPFTFDSAAPLVALGSPANGSIVRAGTVLRFNITELNLVNSTWNNGTGGDRPFGTPFDVPTDGWVDREYNITVVAQDAAGNVVTRVFRFEIDSTPPEVLLLSPGNGSWLVAGAVINFGVTDAHAVNVSILGSPTALSAAYGLDTTSWADGTYALSIMATDPAGNNASLSALFRVDSTAPVVTQTPVNLTHVRAGTNLNFNIAEANLASAAWRFGSGSFAPFASNFSVGTGGLGDGTVRLDVRAQDFAGNTVTVPFTFVIDSTVPTLVIVSPGGVTYLRSDVPIDLGISDATPLTINVTLNGNLVAATDIGGGMFRVDLGKETEGLLEFNITVTDSAGNAANIYRLYRLDNTAPQLPATLPMSFAGNEDGPFSFMASATDNAASPSELNFTWTFDTAKRTLALEVLYGENATFIFTEPGNYAVNLTVSDPAGNLNGTNFTVNILDITPPNLTIIQKFLNATEDIPLYLNRTVVNGSDVGGNLTWIWSDGAGGNATSTGPDIAWLFEDPGDYNLTLIVKDPQNNTAAGYILVHVFDVTPPVIMINGPGVIDVFLNASFNSTGTFDNDGNSTPAQLNYTWVFSKGTTNLAVQFGQFASFRPNASGDVLVTLNVRDTSGNTGNVTTTLKVNLPPIIFSSPPTETNLSSPWSWTPDVIDPEGQTVTINVSQGPAGMTVSGGTVAWTPGANQTGAQNVTIAFFDGFTTVFRSFTVFVVDPASFAGNHLPVFESEPPTDARVRTDYLYDITVTDADGDPITITVTGLDGSTYNTATRRLRWTPPWQPGPDEQFARDITVKITAFDGKQTSTQEFLVRFRNPPNIWPQLIGSFSIGNVHVGDTISVRLIANWTDRDDLISNLTFAINDTDTATRALQASIVRWHVDLTDAANPLLVFEIIGNGSVTFNFVARDPSGGKSDNALVVVNAAGAGPPPTTGLPWWLWIVLAAGGLAIVGGVIVSLRRSHSAARVAQTALDTASKAPTERVIVQQMPAAAAEAKKDTYLIEGVFVIYQDGRMIYSKTDIGNVKLEDPELIASMFSAVTSFIKDSFKQQGELNRLGFGDNTILIERGSYVFMAAIVYGEPTPELAESMRETIRTVENAYAGIIEEWDGSVTSLEAIDQYLAPFLATTAHLSRADVDQSLKEKGIKMLSELEFFQGFVRLKCGVKNDTDSVITKVTVSIDFNEDVLRLHHIEPETYKRQGSEVQLGVLNPGEKVSVAYYFDPQICTESQIDGIARYRDSKGQARSVTMKTRKAEVVCPIFFTKEHANTAMLKRLVEGELDQRDSKVFNVVDKPASVTWAELFGLTKDVVLSHDVHMVREFLTPEPFHGEAWFYGETKVKGYKIVIRTSLIEEGGRIEFFAASTVIPAITGLLAEFNHTLQSMIGRKFSTVKLDAEYSQTVKDDIQKKSLMAQMGEGELEGGETEQHD